jgi:hypothetical protein
MNEIKERLQQIENIFIEGNAPIFQYLNPGLPEAEIVSFFEKNKLPIHDDLLALYKWHNGVKSLYGIRSSFTQIIPEGSFPNLIEMKALRNDFMSYTYFEVERRHEYLPILSGGEDHMYLLRTTDGQIFLSSPGIQIECEFEFSSLAALLEVTVKAYKEQLIHMDPNEGLVVEHEYWNFIHG